ncbi:PAS domain-containing protein, partial [Actinomadura adrarensis]
MDASGTILQCDRNAAAVLGDPPGDLLGTRLGDLIAGAQETLDEALEHQRERTTMLTVDTRQGGTYDAVVTVHPMSGGEPGL